VFKRVLGVSLLVLLALGLVPARAEEGGQPAVYTYVAEWAVPREQWRDYAKATADEKVALDKLVADGTLIGYGDFSVLLHQEGRPTHGSWFTATSRAGLLNALDAIYKLPQVTFPVMAASKHWDFLNVSRMYGMKSGKTQGGYLGGANFKVKPGSMSTFMDISKKHVVPIMEKLKNDGVVNLYSIETEDFHSEAPGTVTFVYVTVDAAGIDKVGDAVDAVFANHPEVEASFRSSVEPQGHNDFLGRVANMVNK
jgi:hypothetical protein